MTRTRPMCISRYFLPAWDLPPVLVLTLPLFILPRFPLSLESRAELCRFVAMCIFTCTAQHSSVHLGQVICVIASPGLLGCRRWRETPSVWAVSLNFWVTLLPVVGLVCVDPKWPMYHAEAPTHLQGCDREGYSGRIAFPPAGADADNIHQVSWQTPACHGEAQMSGSWPEGGWVRHWPRSSMCLRETQGPEPFCFVSPRWPWGNIKRNISQTPGPRLCWSNSRRSWLLWTKRLRSGMQAWTCPMSTSDPAWWKTVWPSERPCPSQLQRRLLSLCVCEVLSSVATPSGE